MAQSHIPFTKNVSIAPSAGHTWTVCKSGAVLAKDLSFDAALKLVKSLGAKPTSSTQGAARALGVR
jgi:hypothetical protein